jgi:hypothetical protein
MALLALIKRASLDMHFFLDSGGSAYCTQYRTPAMSIKGASGNSHIFRGTQEFGQSEIL